MDGYYNKYTTRGVYIRNPSNQNGELSFLKKKKKKKKHYFH